MAGNTLMSLLIKLGVDSGGFSSELDKAENKSKSVASSIGNGFKNIGKGLAVGAAVVGAAAVGAAVVGTKALLSTIGPASDLGESINAVNVVFEDGAGIIKKYGETAAMTVGLSNKEFNQLSSVTGSFLTNLGYDSDEAARKTISLTERAADMASVFNTDVGSALAAIQSGLKGEFNPLEQFGVKMNAALIEAKALSMGLVDSTVDMTKLNGALLKAEKAQAAVSKATEEHGANSLQAREASQKFAEIQDHITGIMQGQTGDISDNAKAQAALALIMEQTDKVAGDFSNTSDGLANSQRQLGALTEDLKAKIGKGLLPAAEAITGALKKVAASPEFQAWLEKVTAGVAKLGTWIANAVPGIVNSFMNLTKGIGGGGSGFLGKLERVVKTVKIMIGAFQDGGFKRLFTVFEDGSSYIGSFLEALGVPEGAANKMVGVFGKISKAVQEFGNKSRLILAKFKDNFAKLMQWINGNKDRFKQFFENVKAAIANFVSSVIAFAPVVVSAFQSLVGWIAKTIPVVIQKLLELGLWFSENKGVIVAILAALGVAFVAWAATAVTALLSTAAAAIAAAVPFLPLIAVMALVAGAAYLIYQAWTTNFGGIQEKVAAFVAWFKLVWQALAPVFEFVFAQLKTVWQAFSALFQGDFVTFGEKLREGWDRLWEFIKTIFTGAWEFIKSQLREALINMQSNFKSIDWGAIGKSILQGIGNGLKAGVGALLRSAKNIASAISDTFKGFFGIHSPSILMEGFGQNIVRGLALGMEETKGELMRTAHGLSVIAASAGQTGAGKSGKATPSFESFTPESYNSFLQNAISSKSIKESTYGLDGGKGGMTINIQNPKSETSEESIRKTLKSLSFLGVTP